MLRRSLRFLNPALLVAALALGACNGADNPLAPADTPATVGEPAAADFTLAAGTTQRIAFVSYRNNNQADIYKMDPQGTSLARLTSTGDGDISPAWSWDNKHIALVRPRPNGNTFTNDIWVINGDGSNGHWVRPTPFPYYLAAPAWSPDGSRLLVAVSVNNISYIGWMDVATGQMGLFNAGTGGVPGYQPSYDKSGQRILFVGGTGKTIEQMNADGTGRKTRLTATSIILGPTFSPDGKKIAYGKDVNGDMEVFVKSFVDGTNKRLTTSAGSDIQPTWSPDGSKLAFASKRAGPYQVYTMPATGGSPARITHTSTAEEYPAWSH